MVTSKTDSRVAFSPDLARNLRELGWNRVDLLDRVDSTNTYATSAAAPWHLVAAHEQFAGRGRLARAWEVPAGSSISLSTTIPLPEDNTAWGWVPLFAGVAVLETCQALGAEKDFTLKWPNDVLAREVAGPRAGQWAKVAGLLCQVIPAPTPLVVIGVGLNVSQTRAQLPVPTATSLALLDVAVERDEILRDLAARLRELGQRWNSFAERQNLQAQVRRKCGTIGSDVVVHTPAGEKIRTHAEGIDETGRLLTRVPGESSGEQPRVVPAAVAYSVADIEHVRPAHEMSSGD